MLAIDERAPAVDGEEIQIEAPVDVVFATLTDFASWPDWQEDVSTVATELRAGAPEVGGTFEWRSRGTRIRSRIELLEAPAAIGWRGRALGTEAIHIWRLQPSGQGTLVRTEESMAGWLASALRGPMRRALRRGLASAAAGLKAEAERRGRAAGVGAEEAA